MHCISVFSIIFSFVFSLFQFISVFYTSILQPTFHILFFIHIFLFYIPFSRTVRFTCLFYLTSLHFSFHTFYFTFTLYLIPPFHTHFMFLVFVFFCFVFSVCCCPNWFSFPFQSKELNWRTQRSRPYSVRPFIMPTALSTFAFRWILCVTRVTSWACLIARRTALAWPPGEPIPPYCTWSQYLITMFITISPHYLLIITPFSSVAETDSMTVESGFDEQEFGSAGQEVIKFVSRFVDQVCTDSQVSVPHVRSVNFPWCHWNLHSPE